MNYRFLRPKGLGRAAGRPILNGFCAIMSFTLVIVSFTNVSLEPLADSAEFYLEPAEIESMVASRKQAPTMATFSVASSFSGPNRDAKTDRRRAPTATEIALDFTRLRFQIAEARVPKSVPMMSATQTATLGKDAPSQPVDTMKVASIGQAPGKSPSQEYELAGRAQEMPKAAALDAIEGIANEPGDAIERDPTLPFPLKVPTKLAYARDNAPKTKDLTQPLTQASMDANAREEWCMATAVYFEARGEKYRGQVAVAQVVRNRVKHKAYPNSICGVVFQNQTWRNRCQFSFACDGIPERVNEKQAWATAEEIAQKVIKGDVYLPEVANSTHYHATYVSPHWAPKLKRMAQIGTHIFYRFKNS